MSVCLFTTIYLYIHIYIYICFFRCLHVYMHWFLHHVYITYDSLNRMNSSDVPGKKMLWSGWIIVTSREKVVLVGSILPNDSFRGWVKHYSSTILWMYIICNFANMKRGRSGLQDVRCIFDTFWLFPIDHPTIPGKMSYTKESHVAIETGVLLSLSPQDRYEWVCWWCCFL